MTLMQVRMFPGDVAVHIWALKHIGQSTKDADVIEHAAQLSAHLQFRATRLWGTNWQRDELVQTTDRKPTVMVETFNLPEGK